MQRKKRVLIISDTIKRNTGYSTVTKSILKNIDLEKYDVAQFGLSDVATKVEYNIDYYTTFKDHSKCCGKGLVLEHVAKGTTELVYITPTPFADLHNDQNPCIRGQHIQHDSYGYQSCIFVINHFRPDIVVSINDIWGLYNINLLRNRDKFKFMPYLAIDSECLFPSLPSPDPNMPPLDTSVTIMSSDKVIIFTDWAKKVIDKTLKLTVGEELKNYKVIPHGVDTDVWKPLDNKIELRETHFPTVDKTDFLIGTISRNQTRKKFDLLMMSLAKFIKKYENPKRKVKCYFHCVVNEPIGWDIKWLAAYYGIQDRCIFNDELKPGTGPSSKVLNEMTNCFDAHVLLSNSEGWGLSILETMAAGIPNITTNYSAAADWAKHAALFAKVAAYEHDHGTCHLKAIADIDDTCRQIKLLYDSEKTRDLYSSRSIDLANTLKWKDIAKEWENLIDTTEVEEDINRYFRFKTNHNSFVIPEFPVNPTTTEFSLIEV